MEPNARLGAIAPLADIDEITPLLIECGLSVSDISLHHQRFVGIRRGNDLVAVAGLEPLESLGLLRSLAVAPVHRHLGLARLLVFHIEKLAADEGIHTLYLLTTTASAFFKKLGYRSIPRTEAPKAVQSTSQFSGLCPQSSDLLCKQLEPASASVLAGPGPD